MVGQCVLPAVEPPQLVFGPAAIDLCVCECEKPFSCRPGKSFPFGKCPMCQMPLAIGPKHLQSVDHLIV